MCLAAPGCGAAADMVYYFVDEKGVPHYSNVPADPRYKPLGPSGAAGSLAPAPAASPPAPVTAAPLQPVPAMPTGDPLPPDEGDDDR